MRILYRLVCAFGAAAALCLTALAVVSNGLPHAALTLLFLLLIAGAALLLRRLPPLPRWGYLLIAALVCLIPRLLAIACLPVDTQPIHDFATYFRLARSFAENGPFVESSCNLFPHILFYSLFLSVPFRLFGSSILTYQLLNLALSLGSVCLVYVLGKRFFQKKAAFLAALLFALSPTLILYAPLNCHEHLCLFLTLLFLLLFLCLADKPPAKYAGWACAGAGLGAALLALELIRPLGAVLILACLCWLFLRLRRDKLPALRPLLLSLAVFLAVFSGGKALVYRACDGLRPQPLARSSYAFTLLAGSNADCGGQWNAEDSAFFLETMRATYDDGFNYEAGTARVMEVVKQRYLHMGPARFLRLAAVKNAALWGDQKSVVHYLRTYRDEARPSLLDRPALAKLLGHSCDAALSALLLLMAACCLLRLRPSAPAMPQAGDLGVIGVLGFVCMYTLTEAAGRYTVSALPLLLLPVCALLSQLLSRKEAQS